MWECGLKRTVPSHIHPDIGVTPYVGVWIETGTYICERVGHRSHSLCGSVD